MKKLIALFAILSFMQIGNAFALIESATPTVDDPVTPVNASKVYITGTASAGAKIIVTGGSYEISPVYADDDGKFSILVALQQEKTNTYHIKAQEEDKDFSETVDVTIVESDAQAAEYETLTGTDRSAPEAPDLDEDEATTSDSYYYIEGSGEPSATVVISGSSTASGAIDSSGRFKVKVALKGDETEETFSVSVKDAWGNVSTSSKIKITGTSSVAGELEDEDEDDEDEEDDEEFTDISDHWAKDYINALRSLGIVGGYSDGRFGPNDYVTRAQLLKMALLAFEHEVEGSDDNFDDVMTDSWYSDYVSYAKSQAIIGGYSDGTFKPDNYVNRAEALKIIFVAGNISVEDEDTDETFSDITSDDWFIKYCAYAKANGIIGGYSDGTFRGGQYITRAEVAKILSLMIE